MWGSLGRKFQQNDGKERHVGEEFVNEAAFHRERPSFIDFNTAILSSAAIERLFSVGKDVLKPKRSGLTDQNFEMLVVKEHATNQ